MQSNNLWIIYTILLRGFYVFLMVIKPVFTRKHNTRSFANPRLYTTSTSKHRIHTNVVKVPKVLWIGFFPKNFIKRYGKGSYWKELTTVGLCQQEWPRSSTVGQDLRSSLVVRTLSLVGFGLDLFKNFVEQIQWVLSKALNRNFLSKKIKFKVDWFTWYKRGRVARKPNIF